MSFQRENYEIYTVIAAVLGLTFIVLVSEWLLHMNLIHFVNEKVNYIAAIFYTKMLRLTMPIRLLYIGCNFALFYLRPPLPDGEDQNKFIKILVAIFVVLLFALGYAEIFLWDILIYPILIVAVVFSSAYLCSLFGKKFSDENIFGISNEKMSAKLSYTFNTDQGPLTIHSAEQHMYVQGGSGSGKSDSVLKPTLYQHVLKDLPALIYDYKGNPPTLGKTAHTGFVHAKLDKRDMKTKLKFLNFADPTRSNRVNPFSPKYLKETDDIEQLVSTLLKNYNASFRNPKDDIWFIGASAIWVGLILRIKRHPELYNKLCLPLLIELLLTDDHAALLKFILDDPEAKKYLSSIVVAQDGSPKQFTGYITSANGFCSKLVSEKIYWLMSADEINLNINSKDEPTFLCVAAVEGKGNVYSPLAAVVIDVVSNYFLEQNKLPTLFQLDEIYTIYLEKLPLQANVFRSNGVSLQIGNQLKAQMDEMYEKKADILIGACGNQFYGQSSDGNSSKMLVEMLSDVDKHSVSVSTSDSGVSKSDSTKRQKAVEIRDLASQKTGHFTGKVANGNPAFFSAQFDRYAYHSEEIDIPAFVLDDITIDELNNEMKLNYQNICNLALEIINDYREVN